MGRSSWLHVWGNNKEGEASVVALLRATTGSGVAGGKPGEVYIKRCISGALARIRKGVAGHV